MTDPTNLNTTDTDPALIGFRTSGLGKVPMEKAVSGLIEAGYSALEFCLEHPEASLETLQYAEGKGLAVSSVSYHGKHDPPGVRIKSASRAAALASAAGAGTVVLGSPASGSRSAPFFPEETVRVFSICRSAGVRPAWETEPGTVLNSLEDWFRLIEPLGPAAGINLDLGHLHLSGECTVEAISRLGGRILHVHLEGMRRGIHEHLIPGKGDIDWGAALQGLDRAGYHGPMVIDLFRLPEDWINCAREACVALKCILGYATG